MADDRGSWRSMSTILCPDRCPGCPAPGGAHLAGSRWPIWAAGRRSGCAPLIASCWKRPSMPGRFYDLLAPLVDGGARWRIPCWSSSSAAARVKTDTRDTLHLARLLAANLIPQVWVPPPAVRELRALVAHRERLVGQRTQAINRLHSVSAQSQPRTSRRKRPTGPHFPLAALEVACVCSRIARW